MDRLNSGIYDNLINTTLGEVNTENNYLETGVPVNVYEFDIVSGFIYINERGENSITTNPDNNRTNIMVQTSNEPIVCYWTNSYHSTLDDSKTSSTKHFQIGKYYEARLLSNSLSIDQGEVEWNDNSFNAFATNKTITMVIKDQSFENIDVTKKLYIILDKKAKSHQWLKVTDVETIYNPETNAFSHNRVTMVNLNLLFSKNGKDILTFVQLAQPGGNYAFPMELETAIEDEPPIKSVQMDPTYLFTLHGVTNVQVEYPCGVGVNSIFLYGRNKSIFTIETPKRLLLYKADVPVPSALQVIGAPATNYYAVFNAKNIMQSFWEDWKTKLEGYYNYLSKKTCSGGFEFNITNARATNKVSDVTGQYESSSFNTWIFAPQAGDDAAYDCKENAYTEPAIQFKKDGNYNVCDFLNMNGFIFQTQMNLPVDYKETTRWELKNIPLIGGFLGGLVSILGFSPGWNKTNQWISGKPINFIAPATTIEMGNTVMGGVGNKFPYDVLTNDNNQFTATGNRLQVCAINAQLTDRFITTNPNYIINGAEVGMGGNGIWNTKYLSQDKDENGNSLNIPKTTSNPDGKLLWHSECKAIRSENESQEFEIDFIDYKVVGKCDCRLTFYTKNTLDGSLETLYETRHQLVSKYKDDGCLWDNYFILNYMTQENSDNYFVWPENPNLPSGVVNNIFIPINIKLSEGFDMFWFNGEAGDKNRYFYIWDQNDVKLKIRDTMIPGITKKIINLFPQNQDQIATIPFVDSEEVTTPVRGSVNILEETKWDWDQLSEKYENISFTFDYGEELKWEKTYKMSLKDFIDNGEANIEIFGDNNALYFERGVCNVPAALIGKPEKDTEWKYDKQYEHGTGDTSFFTRQNIISGNQQPLTRGNDYRTKIVIDVGTRIFDVLLFGNARGKIKIIINGEKIDIKMDGIAQLVSTYNRVSTVFPNQMDTKFYNIPSGPIVFMSVAQGKFKIIKPFRITQISFTN